MLFFENIIGIDLDWLVFRVFMIDCIFVFELGLNVKMFVVLFKWLCRMFIMIFLKERQLYQFNIYF